MSCLTVKCAHCAASLLRPVKEVNRSRRLGREFFCDNACKNAHYAQPAEQGAICEFCNLAFVSRRVRGIWTRFCSRSCASAGSVTERRKMEAKRTGSESANLLSVSEAMKRREDWKYAEMALVLEGIDHEFEFEVGEFVFDLYLHPDNLLIEFDGEYHRTDREQMRRDRLKDLAAKENGYELARVPVKAAKVIPAAILSRIENARITASLILDKTRGQNPPGPPIN